MTPEEMVLYAQLLQMGWPEELVQRIVSGTSGRQNAGDTMRGFPPPGGIPAPPSEGSMGDLDYIGQQPMSDIYSTSGDMTNGGTVGTFPPPASPFAPGEPAQMVNPNPLADQGRGSLASLLFNLQGFRPNAENMGMSPGTDQSMGIGAPPAPRPPVESPFGTGAVAGFNPGQMGWIPRDSSPMQIENDTAGGVNTGGPPRRDAMMIAHDLMRGAQKALPEQAAAPAQRNAFGNNPKAVQNRVNRESKVTDRVNRESPYKPQPKPPVRFSKPAAPVQKRLAPAGGAARNRY